ELDGPLAVEDTCLDAQLVSPAALDLETILHGGMPPVVRTQEGELSPLQLDRAARAGVLLRRDFDARSVLDRSRGRSAPLAEDLPVDRLELLDVEREVLGGPHAGTKAVEESRLANRAIERSREIVRARRIERQSVDAIADEVRKRADARRDHRHARGERFEDDERCVLEPERGDD